MDSTCYKRLEVTPVNILPSEYTNGTEEAPCHKLPLNDLKRRRLEGCFTEHPLEYEIEECGGASGVTVSLLLFSAIVARILCAVVWVTRGRVDLRLTSRKSSDTRNGSKGVYLSNFTTSFVYLSSRCNNEYRAFISSPKFLSGSFRWNDPMIYIKRRFTKVLSILLYARASIARPNVCEISLRSSPRNTTCLWI